MMLLNVGQGLNPQSGILDSPAESELMLRKCTTEPSKTVPKKRKRVGKTPADKINWTKEEVSILIQFRHVV